MSAALKRLIDEPPFDAARAFCRNLGLVTADEQKLLATKKVALPGCGGVGSLYAIVLARAGIGNFSLADFDRFEVPNFNRQFGAKLSTLEAPKVQVCGSDILDINPHAQVRTFAEGLTPGNVGYFLNGVDVVLDGLDYFAFEARRLLFREARERGIPVVTAAPLGFSTALLAFLPGEMSFEEYFHFLDDDSEETLALKFALGLAPRGLHLPYFDPRYVNLRERRGPSHAVGVTLCAAAAVTTALKLLLGRGRVRPAPHYCQFDAFRLKFTRGYLWGGNRNPLQRLKLWVARQRFAKRATA